MKGGSKLIRCARLGCDVDFNKKTHNQKYCSDECCRLATNAKIMEKYYAKRDQRSGKTRYCTVCGETKLSRYNDTLVCSGCATRKIVEANNSVVNMLNNISWQS